MHCMRSRSITDTNQTPISISPRASHLSVASIGNTSRGFPQVSFELTENSSRSALPTGSSGALSLNLVPCWDRKVTVLLHLKCGSCQFTAGVRPFGWNLVPYYALSGTKFTSASRLPRPSRAGGAGQGNIASATFGGLSPAPTTPHCRFECATEAAIRLGPSYR